MGKALPEAGAHTVVTPLPLSTGANVTVAVSLPGSGWVTMLLGQVMVGCVDGMKTYAPGPTMTVSSEMATELPKTAYALVSEALRYASWLQLVPERINK